MEETMTINSTLSQHDRYKGPISGTFRVREPYFGETEAGRPFLRLRLEDCSNHLYAFSWQEQIRRSPGIYDQSQVYIEGEIRIKRGHPFLELIALSPAKTQYPEIVRLIPQSISPRPELLLELQSALRAISIPALKQFVYDVLANDSIAFPFISCPASLHHHHNWPGGLLEHSLSAFTMIEQQRGFTRESYEIGLVAALFHDVGKILTLTPRMTRTSLGDGNEHDKYTFEILSPALQQLASSWHEGAKELRYVLGWKTKSAIPHYNMADLVACSDRISAGLDMDKRRA
jgi:3'-5' exoribonuclease